MHRPRSPSAALLKRRCHLWPSQSWQAEDCRAIEQHAHVGVANPFSLILSTALLLDWHGRRSGIAAFNAAASAIEDGVAAGVSAGKATGGVGGKHATRAVGEVFAALLLTGGEWLQTVCTMGRRSKERPLSRQEGTFSPLWLFLISATVDSRQPKPGRPQAASVAVCFSILRQCAVIAGY